MIYGLANSKGGVGKSTIARNLMVYLNDHYSATALVDAEAGAPTSFMLSKYDPTLKTKAASTLEEMEEAVADFRAQGYSVIIDAPGKLDEQVKALCILSDLVIIPICPAEQDYLQTTAILEMVRRRRIENGGMPHASIVLTLTAKNDIDSPGMRKALSKFQIPLAYTEIRRLMPLRRERSVMRKKQYFRKNGPALEIVQLVEELVDPLLPPRPRIANE